jgi:phosphopantothenoylcysteine decarboxylase/phosphopantothenate--cysteine ligase
VTLTTENPSIKRIDVVSAKEMLAACKKEFPKMDAGIFAAAVADYRAVKVAPKKIKKENSLSEIKLTETDDILATISASKKKGQVIAGFALETDNAVANAKKKLKRKQLDFIVVNSPDKKTGFGTETNKVSIIDANGKTINFELKLKKDVALDIVKHLESKLLK